MFTDLFQVLDGGGHFSAMLIGVICIVSGVISLGWVDRTILAGSTQPRFNRGSLLFGGLFFVLIFFNLGGLKGGSFRVSSQYLAVRAVALVI